MPITLPIGWVEERPTALSLFVGNILLIFLALFGIKFSLPLIIFPFILLIQFIFTYGLALIISSVAVQFRDLLHIVPNLLTIWFFLTPVFYPITIVPEKYRVFINLNPMGQLIKAYQDIFFYNQFPALAILVILAAISFALLVVGFSFFEARKDLFAEEV